MYVPIIALMSYKTHSWHTNIEWVKIILPEGYIWQIYGNIIQYMTTKIE